MAVTISTHRQGAALPRLRVHERLRGAGLCLPGNRPDRETNSLGEQPTSCGITYCGITSCGTHSHSISSMGQSLNIASQHSRGPGFVCVVNLCSYVCAYLGTVATKSQGRRSLCAIYCPRTDDTVWNCVLGLESCVLSRLSNAILGLWPSQPSPGASASDQCKDQTIFQPVPSRRRKIPSSSPSPLCTRARADAALALETGHYHPPSVFHAADATANPYPRCRGRGTQNR